jgi:hypothetical protein
VPAVVIAASNLAASLCDHLADEGELLTFPDTEPIQALQAILEQRPGLIVLERLFAATPRGAALINRIKTDPQLAHAQVRVMSHTGDYMREIARSPAAASAVGAPAAGAGFASGGASAPGTTEAPRLDWQGTRRAPRYRMKTGVEIQLDGNPVALIDVSTAGAQVLSGTILRPNQKVRVIIPQDDSLVRCRGAVAWAKFELPNASAAPVYRAGVEFLDVDPDFIEGFTSRNRR